MHVEGVKRHSKYAVRAHNIFAHNFLNIELIFNPKKVLESRDLGLSNHTIKCFVCRSMSKGSKVISTFDFLLKPPQPGTGVFYGLDKVLWYSFAVQCTVK